MANRKDSNGRVLRSGERERGGGGYEYRYTLKNGKRKSLYAATLPELRRKERELTADLTAGINVEASNITLNDMFELWKDLKKGIKDNTLECYKYMYTQYVEDDLGRYRIKDIRKSDVRSFYSRLYEQRSIKISTIDRVHMVIHQILDIAVEDEYIKANPSNNAMGDLKKMYNVDQKRRKSLTRDEEALFLNYVRESNQYRHWYPLFAVMFGTGMRIGEVAGLRWKDIDLEKRRIDVNHTVVAYNKNHKMVTEVNSPKTPNSVRIIPMTEKVRDAFLMELRRQKREGITCNINIGKYTDFIFLNRNGEVFTCGVVNKAIKRIIRDCNEEILSKDSGDDVLLVPHFSCHSTRHTFTTRMCESGANMKVVQSVLGHSDITTTLNIYTSVTDDMLEESLELFEKFAQ